jgi:hypothetical protein
MFDTDVHICSLCGKEFTGFGNNPEPLAHYRKRCCDECNADKVIPARIDRMYDKS